MTHADAFLQDILAHPDDDAPRLIFADWLEEQGDTAGVARAEFIRVQCALASGQLPPPRKAKLRLREQQLRYEWEEEWAHPIRRLVETWQFHRGFIEEISIRSDSFIAVADRLCRKAPIQRLSLMHPRQCGLSNSVNVAAIADNENLRRLRFLSLNDNRLESRDVNALVVSEHLTSLTTLDLSSNRIGDGGLRALASAPLLGRLERLNLSHNDVGAVGLRALSDALDALVRSPEGLRLQALVLSHDSLSAAGRRVIVRSPLLRQLMVRV